MFLYDDDEHRLYNLDNMTKMYVDEKGGSYSVDCVFYDGLLSRIKVFSDRYEALHMVTLISRAIRDGVNFITIGELVQELEDTSIITTERRGFI